MATARVGRDAPSLKAFAYVLDFGATCLHPITARRASGRGEADS
jgi:hypothetical protein